MDSIADSSSSAERIYSPLADSDEIRLLCLQPRVSGSPNRPIKCTIKHIKLSSKTRYEALSYMWGPQVFRAIELDGKLCKVRINLWQALFRLRFENRSRILWIDALCINQADLNERNHQVTQMGKIYRNASTVVAWLGEPDSASSAAIKMLLEAGLGRASRVAYPILFRDCPTNALDAVHAIFLQEYWTRLWIVQEVTLAWEVILQWGTEIIAWDYLDSLVSYIDKAELPDGLVPLPEPQPNVEHLKEGWSQSLKGSALAKLVRRRRLTKEMMRNKLGGFSYYLLHLCSDHGEAKCVDPRDKIFGMHALAEKCCTDAVPVDYSLSLFQISTRVLCHHALSHNNQLELVSESRKLHDALGISLGDLDEISKMRTASLSGENYYDEPLFSVHCRGTGRISYVDSLSEEEVTRKQQPELSSWVWKSLFKPGERLQLNKSISARTTQLGLVCPIGSHVIYSTQSVYEAIGSYIPDTAATLLNSTPRPRTNSSSNFTVSCDDDYYFFEYQQLLIRLRDVALAHSRLGITVAFDETGIIILAPNNVRVGDILCRFNSTNALAILRPSQEANGKCYLVGRAVTIELKLAERWGELAWVELQINVRTLQMLTLVSQYPGQLP
jgi:hypothetical protein